MSEQIDKSQTLRRIQQGRARLERVLLQMNDEQISEIPVQDSWTVKDILAHITSWERRLLTWIKAAAAGETPEVLEPGATWDGIDRLNAQTYEASRNRSLVEVMAEFRYVFNQLVEELEAMPDEPGSEGWSVWLDDSAPWARVIAANSYEHYQKYLATIERFNAQTAASLAYIQVFMTTGSKADAARIAQALVEERLAGCVQIVGPITSTYWWNNAVETAEEWLCLVKTHQRVYAELENMVKVIHPYETPEILAMPIVAGSQDYLAWLSDELQKE